ncbi:MAG: hypothetical protein IPI27_09335 [Betaproteobacteria bacterium]|nr:hypothetical protein [Betaproteobacteria bacterium]
MARKVANAPSMTAGASDAAWASAKPLSIKLSGGANFGGTGSTTATLKAVYTSDTLYMLIQYADPTNSQRRGPYQKQADGSWKKLVDPADKGGDDNVYYEDKWAFLWPINNSVKDFAEIGCGAMCHTGEGKPYGNKYTASAGQIADMAHEGWPHRAAGATSTTSTRITRATIPGQPGRGPQERSGPAGTTPSPWSTASRRS